MSASPSFRVVVPPGSPSAALIVCPVVQQGPLDPVEAFVPGAAAVLRQAIERGEFLGKPCELFFASFGSGDRRLVAVGLGPDDKLTPDRWRRAAATAALAARARKFDALAVATPGATPEDVAAVVDGLVGANFDVGTYRTAEPETAALQNVEVLVAAASPAVEQAVSRGRVIGEAVNLARALANEPGNVLSPRVFAERAATALAGAWLAVDVLDEPAIEALGMHLLLGVGRGSAEPPRLLVVRYEPAEVRPGTTLVLVGKGVTFDTGGISIKPSEKMELMKYDMAGGAAVVGAMAAIAALRPPVRVIGVVPAVENMPGGRAIRPGDVLRSASGTTVEVNNTDAEGRLILADALWYAREQAGATHLVDVATLTGACVIALGRVNSGLFGSDPAWTSVVTDVAVRAGDRVWPLPLDEEYGEQIRSDIADLLNTGGRGAGAVTAAKFLQAFTGNLPWVHLDIAGTAWLDESQPWMAKGPTGVMTRTLVGLALAHDRIPARA